MGERGHRAILWTLCVFEIAVTVGCIIQGMIWEAAFFGFVAGTMVEGMKS